MRAASIPADAAVLRPLGSRRLLALARDERLVEQIRRGSDAAFEVAFERHSPAILAFCRHMLGSREEAEDAVQHTFAAAYSDLQRDTDRDIALKPWLFAIARNRCLSMLRGRREQPVEDPLVPTAGLAEQVEQRAELRQLLADVGELAPQQRAALLLAEVGDLSHAQIAGVLGCEVPHVKALVYRARSGLIARREARETPCEEIREQLANLRGGSLRRTGLRLHLRECAGCRSYREQVKRQRELLAVALPVAPTLGLKSSVLAAVGIGGGSAVGGGAAAGLAGAGGAFGGGLGGALAKLALIGALTCGGVTVAGQAIVSHDRPGPAVAPGASGVVGSRPDRAPTAPRSAAAMERLEADGRQTLAGGHPRRGVGRVDRSYEGRRRPTPSSGVAPGRSQAGGGRKLGHLKQALRGESRGGHERALGRGRAHGRGPLGSPHANVPVRRGPPEAPPGHAKPAPRGPGKPAPPGEARRAPTAEPPAPVVEPEAP